MSLRTTGFSLKRKGKILFQKRSTTAKMAPSWITTRNISQKSSLTFKVTNSFKRIICPVLLMGSHSVMPSTIPKSTAFKISIISICDTFLYSLSLYNYRSCHFMHGDAQKSSGFSYCRRSIRYSISAA